MEKQYENTLQILKSLKENKYISKIYYPGYDLDDIKKLPKSIYSQKYIYETEYSGGSSIISFTINCHKQKIFKILNSFKIFKLAVSLGSIESLIQHPSSMTHNCMSDKEKKLYDINDQLIRCSIGLEEPYDLINDLNNTIISICEK